MITLGKAIDPGIKRKSRPNQDSFGWVLPGGKHEAPALLIVADGMGGYAGGALASRTVVDTMTAVYTRDLSRLDPLALLKQCLLEAHQAVVARAAMEKDMEEMGSTAVACIVSPKRIYIANVGDSRLYRIRAGAIQQLSQDQSIVGELVRNGLITPAEALKHPMRSRLNMSISAKRTEIAPYFADHEIEPGDVFILCSDGLWSVVDDEVILGVVNSFEPQAAAQRLVELANQNGGPDNISVIIASTLEGAQRRAAPALSPNRDETSPGFSTAAAPARRKQPNKKFNLLWVLLPLLLLALAAAVVFVPALRALLPAGLFSEPSPTPTAAPAPSQTSSASPTLPATSTATPAPAPTATPTPITPTAAPSPAAGSTTVSTIDGMVQVYVPAGQFLMGSSDSDLAANADENPQHALVLDGYWIDRNEVTNAMFQKFVEQTGYITEAETLSAGGVWDGAQVSMVSGADWRKPRGPSSDLTGKPDHPVVQVSWADAAAYCAWAGRRLPSEAEWEKAARGTDGRLYPWGDAQPDCSQANFASCLGDTAAAGSSPAGASAYGALDMAGNVWEWVADWYSDTYYQSSPLENPRGPASGEFRLVRGGSWQKAAEWTRTALRFGSFANAMDDSTGFRCAAANQ